MNPITSIAGKLGDFITGKRATVNNAADPGSAYSQEQRAMRNANTELKTQQSYIKSLQTNALKGALKK